MAAWKSLARTRGSSVPTWRLGLEIVGVRRGWPSQRYLPLAAFLLPQDLFVARIAAIGLSIS
jgi:hypothetical protein